MPPSDVARSRVGTVPEQRTAVHPPPVTVPHFSSVRPRCRPQLPILARAACHIFQTGTSLIAHTLFSRGKGGFGKTRPDAGAQGDNSPPPLRVTASASRHLL